MSQVHSLEATWLATFGLAGALVITLLNLRYKILS
jgi:hypothetical protein